MTIKHIFINTPNSTISWIPIPIVTSLMGILKNKNIEAEFIDFRLNYNNYATSQEGLSEIVKFYNSILNKIDQGNTNQLLLKILSQNSKILIKNQINLIKSVSPWMDLCLFILKNKKLFYNPILLILAIANINQIIDPCYYLRALNRYFLPKMEGFRVHGKLENFSINVEELICLFQNGLIPFKDLYNYQIDEILKKSPDIIGISIDIHESLIRSLYLCYLLKEKTDIPIYVGGTFFQYYYKSIDNLPELFNKFFNYISIGNNNTIIGIADYLNKKTTIENIPDFIYIKEGKINITKKQNISLNHLPYQSYNGYPIDDYYLPEPVLSVTGSESCYWRKCNFCENHSNKYSCKTPERIVDEIEDLMKKYNTKFFLFWDNAIHPNILSKVADIIIERKLNIKYSVYARCEKSFSRKVLKKIKKSGCLYLNLGLDAPSTKMIKIINKGIDLNYVKHFLKETNRVGIANHIYLILGHPYETIEDIEEYKQYIKTIKNNIDSLSISPSTFFLEGSIIKEKESYYKNLINSTPEERLKYIKEFFDIVKYSRKEFTFSYISLLYIAKKGLKLYKLEKMLIYYIFKYSNLPKYIFNFYIFLYYKLNPLFNYFYK